MNRSCTVCGNPMQAAFRACVLGRHEVGYDHCPACGVLQAEPPFWLEEAYADAIASTDTGLVGRNLYNLRRTMPILHLLLGKDAIAVDLGGGYGLLTRLLRDAGFNAYTFDTHCRNLLAPGFEAQPDATRASALLAFEVLEHLPDPVAFLRSSRERFGGDFLLFSTLPYEGPPPPPSDWWYYAFETGQHVTFYQPRTLAAIAQRLGGTYWRISTDLHALLFRPVSGFHRAVLKADYYLGFYKPWVRWSRRRCSLTFADHAAQRATLRIQQAKARPV